MPVLNVICDYLVDVGMVALHEAMTTICQAGDSIIAVAKATLLLG